MKEPNVDPPEGGCTGEPDPSLTGSLLQRLQAQDGEAWRRWEQLYAPTVYAWCRHVGLSPEDAADVRQEVFQAVARHIAEFRRDRPGDTFRGWLWTVTHNKLRNHRRRWAGQAQAPGGTTAQEQLLQVPEGQSDASDAAPPPAQVDSLYRRALGLIQSEFAERTWRAFWLVAVEDRLPADVAAELGMSPGAVYIAKSRVLRRLREEFADLIG